MVQGRLINTTQEQNVPLSASRQQYHILQAMIDRLTEDISRCRLQQERVVSRFMQDILPLEHQYLQAAYDKTFRLLTFASKKSLSKRDRAALYIWLDEVLEELFYHPFNEQLDLHTLRQQLSALSDLPENKPADSDIDDFRRELRDIFGSDNDLSDDDLFRMMNDPDIIFDTMCGKSENTTETSDDDFFGDGGFAGEHERVPADVPDMMLKSAEITRMYKKLASQLHPDREPDPVKKSHRHDLMVELSKARQSNDIWTIMEMFREHVDPDYAFSDTALPTINALLQRRIDELQHELAGITDPRSLSGMIWEKLGGKTDKVINNRFKKHASALLRMTEEQHQQRDALRSLKVLREYLIPWREELQWESEFEFY
ncbi:J domain-containing protein [Enterobacter sp. JMULE2]|uniref:J domain-containing protein n=1 Tax=Enterobacter sp. JMULE2 TaxID=2518340 RepID=UPI00157604A8|nr:J domain-containing protein [Enterobacter sp. JMULE2]NTZ40939.1 J domain-containing protein [Enterobacter sp. JMULE2]